MVKNGPAEGGKSGLISVFESLRVFPPPEKISHLVKSFRSKYVGSSAEELAKTMVSATTWKLTGAGVVASLPGAVPGLGTATQVGLSAASLTGETWLMLRNLTAMQLVVAGLYDHDPRDSCRKDELLLVWGLTTGAVVPVKEAVKRVGTKVAVKAFNRHMSGKLLQRLNRKLGATVLTKWGTKRGGVALGRLVPFGIGAFVGGGINYVATRAFGRACLRFYGDLLPSDGEVTLAG